MKDQLTEVNEENVLYTLHALGLFHLLLHNTCCDTEFNNITTYLPNINHLHQNRVNNNEYKLKCFISKIWLILFDKEKTKKILKRKHLIHRFVDFSFVILIHSRHTNNWITFVVHVTNRLINALHSYF